MYCYIEIKNKEIVSYGESTSVELALSKTSGTVMEVTELELALVSACRGNLGYGGWILGSLVEKIDKTAEAWQDE